MGKKRPERLIWAQGALDGACFLYSLANAAQCFSNDYDQVCEAWSDLTARIGHAKDFLSWKRGTLFNEDHPQRDVALAREYFKVLAPNARFRVTLVEPECSQDSLIQHVRADSVLLFDDEEHWSCIVDVSRGRAYIACSAELAYGKSEYIEGLSGPLGRPWNVAVQVGSLNFKRAILVELLN